MIKKIFTLFAFIFITTSAFAQNRVPHFFVQMENQSLKETSISFQPVVGNVYLQPSLADHHPLKAHETSEKYGVVFNPLGRNDSFNIVFTGKKDCAFNVAFYSEYNPKITMSGMGCFGGGYRITGNTLVLYVTDIHLKK
jgi:hypothetical protein